jgi:hypothetical protein
MVALSHDPLTYSVYVSMTGIDLNISTTELNKAYGSVCRMKHFSMHATATATTRKTQIREEHP